MPTLPLLLGTAYFCLPFAIAAGWHHLMVAAMLEAQAINPTGAGIYGWFDIPALMMALPWIWYWGVDAIYWALACNALIAVGLFVVCVLAVRWIVGVANISRLSNPWLQTALGFGLQHLIAPGLLLMLAVAFDPAAALQHKGRAWVLRGESAVSATEAKSLCTNMGQYFFDLPTESEAEQARLDLANRLGIDLIFVKTQQSPAVYSLKEARLQPDAEVALALCRCGDSFADRYNCASRESLELPGRFVHLD